MEAPENRICVLLPGTHSMMTLQYDNKKALTGLARLSNSRDRWQTKISWDASHTSCILFIYVIANHGACNELYWWCNGMCRALYIECFNLQWAAASEIAAISCGYSYLFPLAFESGLLMSDYLQTSVALLVFVSVGVGVWVYSGSTDKTTVPLFKLSWGPPLP